MPRLLSEASSGCLEEGFAMIPQSTSRLFQTRRALLRSLAPRYRQASPTQKTLLLDAFGEWTGYTRKYAIELLNHGKDEQQTIQRRRMPHYRQEVQQALFLSWSWRAASPSATPGTSSLILWSPAPMRSSL